MMPATPDEWVQWAERYLPMPCTLPEAKRLACQCFAAGKNLPGPSTAVVCAAAVDALQRHPAFFSHRGQYYLRSSMRVPK